MSVRITDVRVIVTCPGRNYVFLKVMTSEPGLYGVGDATLNGRELAVASALRDHIAPLLIGRDPDRIEDTWQLLFRGTYWRGGPVLQTALAGVDLALWDIKGKRAGLPVCSLLGGKTRECALAYTHAGGRDFEEVSDQVRQAVERGFRVVRAQTAIPGAKGTYGAGGASEAASATWPSPDGGAMPFVETGWDSSRYLRTIPRLFDHLRNALGDDVELLHDVHERLSPIEACRLAADLEPYRLFFLEDPLRPEHADSFRVLRGSSTTPIAMGELFTSKYECLSLVTEQLIDYIRCDIGHIGGITEARKIAAICEPFQVRTAWHGPGDIGPPTHAANVHLDCAIPNFGVQEMTFFPDAVHEVCPGAPEYRDGALWPSDAPGLGVDLNEEVAARHPYRRGYLPIVRKPDGSLQDW
ncbi:MAG: D-galactonate dehydratase family protein [Chthonomonadales bacterium]|nr:D-galactonate dehydratase family protein [Chthonomonadales bacterium]